MNKLANIAGSAEHLLFREHGSHAHLLERN